MNKQEILNLIENLDKEFDIKVEEYDKLEERYLQEEDSVAKSFIIHKQWENIGYKNAINDFIKILWKEYRNER